VATVARNRNILVAKIRVMQDALYYSADAISLDLADEMTDLKRRI
jgi:ClpP class serine protease